MHRQAVEEARAIAARVPGPDGVVSIEGLREFLQYLADHEVDPNEVADEVIALRLGFAEGGCFLTTSTTLLLKQGESALLDVQVQLLKEVTDREFHGGSQGVSIPIGAGVRYRVGAVRGHMVTIGTHWTTADTGTLTVTDQRIVFHGGRKTLEFPFAKLVTLNVYTDAIDLGVTSRQSTSSFKAGNPAFLAGMIHAAFNHRDDGVTMIEDQDLLRKA
jgi:hypothetical protein